MSADDVIIDGRRLLRIVHYLERRVCKRVDVLHDNIIVYLADICTFWAPSSSTWISTIFETDVNRCASGVLFPKHFVYFIGNSVSICVGWRLNNDWAFIGAQCYCPCPHVLADDNGQGRLFRGGLREMGFKSLHLPLRPLMGYVQNWWETFG